MSKKADLIDIHQLQQPAVASTTEHVIPLVLVITLALAYLLPGLIGHDPWKQDETYIFGSIYNMLQSGDWVVPKVAGEPFMEKPPLFHLVAAAIAKLASPLLSLHDGARLASGLFVALALAAVGWSARHTWGKSYGRGAVLLMLSCVGLVVNAHIMLTDLALTAGFAIAVAGFVACRKPVSWSGMLLGTGLGMAFLAKGLIGLGVIGTAALVLPAIFQEWRNRSYFVQLKWAALAALPWLTVWPVALYLSSPEQFHVWFWDNNIGRFIGFSVPDLGAAAEEGYWWKAYLWFLFPMYIFVGQVFWSLRQAAWRQPAVQIGMTLTVVMALVLGVSASARAIYSLPMVVMLALVGAGAIHAIPRWIEKAIALLGVTLGSAAIVFYWLIWEHLITTGNASNWPWLGRWLPLDFALTFSATAVAAATALTIGAIVFVVTTWKSKARGLVIWCASLTVVWGLAATLWLPWIDAAKSYRAMYQNMQLALPLGMTCMASQGLGESERAMLDYVLDIKTHRKEVSTGALCDVLLVQDTASKSLRIDDEMELAWSGNRPGDESERFNLYFKRKGNDLLVLR